MLKTIPLKKLLSLTLALLMLCLCAASCAGRDEEIPKDMIDATLPDEPFRLFVPESWSLNTASGISGALYNSASKILVSARYVTPADPAMTLDSFVDHCSARYGETQTGYTVLARGAALLGGENAVRLDYKITDGDAELTCFQVTALFRGDFISVHGYCASSLYESMKPDYDTILKEFVLREKPEAKQEPIIDKKTPEGFQIASSDKLEYRLYVPLSWTCTPEGGSTMAVYPESGRSNVSVTSYIPTESMSIQDYFASCERTYQEKLPGYERLGETSRTLGGRTAYSYEYKATVEGVSYHFLQTVCFQNERVYSLTYTALDENYALHLADVEAILNAFIFR